MNLSTKQEIYYKCQALVEQRIATARQAMDNAQAAANEEGKSSAGDKYETGRAMMQLERDQHARLLAEALKVKQALEGIDWQKVSDRVQLGSLVKTSLGTFFLAVSLGKLTLAQKEYMAISPRSPIGELLLGKKAGERFSFNQRQIEVLALV